MAGRRGRGGAGTPGRGARRRAGAWVLVAALLLPAGAAGQDGAATGTRAVRGAAWGGAVGGVLGGLGLGVLAWGLCDAAECDGTFVDGFAVGAALGGVAGATAGMVVGSAFPRGGRAVGGWSWTARAGARAAFAHDLDGVGPDLGIRVSRGVTEAVRVGLAAEYLGRAEEVTSSYLTGRDGTRRLRIRRRGWVLSSVRMEAERILSPGARRTGWLSAGFGVYPTRESWEERTAEGASRPGPSYHEWIPAPGVAVGAGVRVPVAGRWSVELGGLADVALGVGSDDWLPLLRLGVGLRRDPPPRP